jgi:hypothetical protein
MTAPSGAPPIRLDMSQASALAVTHTRSAYLRDVEGWALLMLAALRPLPTTVEKLDLMRQLDKIKEARRIETPQLPAYAGALAVLTYKAASLSGGKTPVNGYAKETVVRLLQSPTMRRLFDADPTQMMLLKEFLNTKTPRLSSETLRTLARSGH